MTLKYPSSSNDPILAQVHFEGVLCSDQSELDSIIDANSLQKILTEHTISKPINELGTKLIEKVVQRPGSPSFNTYQKLHEVVSSYKERLEQLKDELFDKQCDWHRARNDNDWAEDSKGEKYDEMRCEIKGAMSEFAAALTMEITGNRGQYKDFGTQGYKSDIDLTYIPDEKNKDFSYASGKLIFDAVFASTFNRTPEDLLDLEVYVQHPGKSMHTGEVLKTGEGITNFHTAELQAAFQKIKDPKLAQELEEAICKGAPDSTKVGIKALMKDVEEFNISIADLKTFLLPEHALEGGKITNIYSPESLNLKFADASFRDTLIYDIYQNYIQNIQEQIQTLKDELALSPTLSGANSLQNTASFADSAFNNVFDAMERGNHFDRQNSTKNVYREISSSITELTSPGNHSDRLQTVRSRFFAESLSHETSHNSLLSDDDLQITSRNSSFTELNNSQFHLSKIESHGQSSLSSDLSIASREGSFTKLNLPSLLVRKQLPLNSSKSSLAEIKLRRNQTGIGFDHAETPVSLRQKNYRLRIDDLYVQQARLATITESLTKEGFNTQGALRDIVENRDGQEDTKYAKQILNRIFALEAKGEIVPKDFQRLFKDGAHQGDISQKILNAKLASSHTSLLFSALENYHFYTTHLQESLDHDLQSKKIDSPTDNLQAQATDTTASSSYSSPNAVINESKYELRFAAKALDFYKELSKSKLMRYNEQNLELQSTSDLEKNSSNLSKVNPLQNESEISKLSRSSSVSSTAENAPFSQEISELEDLLADADDLEKMKRQEQLPFLAFEEKLDKLELQGDAQKSVKEFIRGIFDDFPRFTTPRLGDIVHESKKDNGKIELHPNLMTNMGYYIQMISKFTGPMSPFKQEILSVGNIRIPIVKLNIDDEYSASNRQKVQDINTWIMATSGFPPSFYALSNLKESELMSFKNKSFSDIERSLNERGNKIKRTIFEEARTDILRLKNLDSYEGVRDYYNDINQIYGQLVRNAFTTSNLLHKSKDFWESCSLSRPFEEIKEKLITA